MRSRFFHHFVPVLSVAILTAVVTNSFAQEPNAPVPNQGYCTVEEAKAINDRGLANLYHSNPTLDCADFLAAIDAGKCPGAVVSQQGPTIMKGVPPISQETMYYVRDQFRYYDIYDPYPWELYYVGLEPDFFDQQLALAILLLQRNGIFDVFPGELVAFVNDRAHFRDHIRDIKNRIGRTGSHTDAFGNHPLHLAALRPAQGVRLDPRAMRRTINHLKTSNPNLFAGKGAGAIPGPIAQPNVLGKGAMVAPNLSHVTPGAVLPNLNRPHGHNRAEILPHGPSGLAVTPHMTPHVFNQPVVRPQITIQHGSAAPHIAGPVFVPHGGGGGGGMPQGGGGGGGMGGGMPHGGGMGGGMPHGGMGGGMPHGGGGGGGHGMGRN
jgi:hypothetical protein